MTYEAHRETVGRFTVRVVADDDYRSWDDWLCDQPVLLCAAQCRHSWALRVQHDNSKRLSDRTLHAAWILDRNGFADMMDVLDVRYEDHQTPTGRLHIKADIWDWKGRTFRDEASAAAAIFKHETGLKLRDVRFETIDTRSDTLVLGWYQPELDAYAGGPDAPGPVETVRNVVEGNVWGYIIGDDDDDHLESCWGFVGDSEHCLSEGRDVAECMEREAAATDAEATAAAIAEARPDLSPTFA